MEYINESKVNTLKKKIIESMSILKSILYDENGARLSDNNYISEEEEQKSLNLLKDYEEKLKKLNDNEPVYSRIICLKKKELPFQVIDDVTKKRSKRYQINIPSKGILEGVYSYIQQLDGNYHDAVVLYKGFSEEYNTEFICYYDMSDKRILVSPVLIKDNKIIRSVCSSKEMSSAFGAQFFSTDFSIDELSTVPNIIGCLNAKQYEEYTVNVAIGGKKKSFSQEGTFFKNSLNNNERTNLSDSIYHYRAKFSSEELYEKTIVELQKGNPSLLVYGERFGCYNALGSKFKDNAYVISLSSPINNINDPQNIFRRGNYSYFKSAVSILSNDDYDKLKKKHENILENHIDKSSIENFINYLIKNNPDVEISYEYDNQTKFYRLISSLPYSSISYKNTLQDDDKTCDMLKIDKNGYILLASLDVIEYKCDNKLNCDKTTRVYIDDDIVSKLVNKKKENESTQNQSTLFDENQTNSVELQQVQKEEEHNEYVRLKKELESLKAEFLIQKQQIDNLQNKVTSLEQMLMQEEFKMSHK